MRIEFQFEGGVLDGKVACSDSADLDEARAAETFYWLSDHGCVGHSVEGVLNEYQVAEHVDHRDEVIVLCKEVAAKSCPHSS